MISQEDKEKIDTLLCESEDVADLLTAIPAMRDEELNYLVRSYNWDDGFVVPQAVADHSQCDLATALEMFWLSGAVEALGLPEAPAGRRRDWFAFARRLTTRIVSGSFPTGPHGFDPGLTRVEQYRFRKQGVPEILLSPIEPSGG